MSIDGDDARRDMSITEADVQNQVTALLRDHIAASDSSADEIIVVRRDAPVNGYSNVTTLFDASWKTNGRVQPQAFVLRTQPEGRELFFDTPLHFQWEMMKAIEQHSDVPVPRLVLLDRTGESAGTPFFVMEAVDGLVPRNGSPSYHAEGWVADLPPERRRALALNALQALVEIHALDWREACPFLDRPDRGATGLDQVLTYQERWYDWVGRGRSVPGIEEALRWLRAQRPAGEHVCISWGDSRPGNMIFSADQSVAAVIDWEMAMLGVPEMDVSWWLMFEELFTDVQATPRLEGIPDRAELVAEYERRSERTLDDLLWYDVLNWTRMAICCLKMFAPEPTDSWEPIEEPFLRRIRELLGTSHHVTD
jgi:aminoglycoside phosphotransferase (APT) family kinase protein